MKEYFDNLVSGLEGKIQEHRTARRLLVYEMGRLGQKMFSEKYSVGWTTVFVPFEIFQTMNVVAFFVEFVGAMLANTGFAGNFLQRAEQEGYSTDGCSYHRCVLGAALQKIIPEPKILIGATCPCDGGLKAVYQLGYIYKKPAFTLQIPHECTRESIQYLVSQYHEMIDYITEKTGVNFDIDKLREIIRCSNKSYKIIKQVYEMCKHIPSPITGRELKNFAIIFALIASYPEGTDVARQYVKELEDKISKNIGGLPKEKYRLLWIQNRIQFKNRLVENLEDKFGANVVIDELNHIYWDDLDETNPLEALAERQIMHQFNGDLQRRIEVLKQQAVEYKVDGAIFPSHWGCRQSCGARKIFRDALAEINVPMIALDVDCVDERNFSEGQLMTRLEGFMEMLG